MPNISNTVWLVVGVLIAIVAIVWLVQNVNVN